MNKELEFIEIGPFKPLNHYITHMENLFRVELNVGDTYNILFENLLKRIELLSPEIQEAAKDWIQFNKDQQSDHSVFNQILLTSNNTGNAIYAVFNVFTQRNITPSLP